LNDLNDLNQLVLPTAYCLLALLAPRQGRSSQP
jgi:hypothetical protein